MCVSAYNKCVCMCACFFPGVIKERVHAFMHKTTCVCECVEGVCVCVEAGRGNVVQWLVNLAHLTNDEEEEVWMTG